MLDELYACVLLLPQLEVPVNGSRQHEAGPAVSACPSAAQEAISLRHSHIVDNVPVHERLIVPVRIW